MSRVTIVGAGLLGRGIAAVVASHGHDVTLHDSSPEALRTASEQLRSVRTDTLLEHAVRTADYVIEAILEDLPLKQQLFARIGVANPQAILMSNSSSLPIGRIAAHTARPERAVGTHWWNPPQLIPIVEVIRGPRTDAAVIAEATEFLTGLGKQAVQVSRDVPGFVGNRLQHALWREAIGQLSRGEADAPFIDRLIAETLGRSLARRGPIAELCQLDPEALAALCAQTLPELINDPDPAPALCAAVAAGQLGAKSGQGFLAWPPGRREQAAERLAHHVQVRLAVAAPAVPTNSNDAAATAIHTQHPLARRLQLAVWREALALVASAVCTAEVVDQVACRTFGLRLAVMGPIENADYVGLDLTLAIHAALLPSLSTDIDPSVLLRAASGARSSPPTGLAAGSDSP